MYVVSAQRGQNYIYLDIVKLSNYWACLKSLKVYREMLIYMRYTTMFLSLYTTYVD